MIRAPSRRVAVIAVFAVLLVGAGVAVGSDVTTIDEDTALTDSDTIDGYEEDGVATADVEVPDMTITIAEQSDDVGLDGWHSDWDSRYLRLQYDEDIPRTVRVYVPSEYWHPVSYETTSVNGDTQVTMRPTENGRYTAVTVEFDGQADAVIDLPKANNFVFWSRDGIRSVANETVGYEAPRLSTGGEWEYITDSDFAAGNGSVPIDDSEGSTIQYNAADNDSDERWVSVPECSRGEADVCTYTVDGRPDTVMVLSTTSEPPSVRYKTGADPVEKSKGWFREMTSAPEKLFEDISGLFGGGEEE